MGARPDTAALRLGMLVGLLLAGIGCVAGGAPPPSAARPPAPAAREELPQLPVAFGGSRAARATPVEADLIRRGGGEWVIVEIRPTERPAGARPGVSLPARDPDSAEAGVGEALRRYELALESGDTDRLARTWVMNPSERAQVDRLIGDGSGVSVSIRDATVVVEGDEALLAFVQQVQPTGGPGRGSRLDRALRRAMAATDAIGRWAVDTLGLP